MANICDEEQAARLFYGKINEVECPKFNGEKVFFNRIGFNHLIRKNGRRRRKSDRRRRFNLLHYAPNMIADPHIDVAQRVKGRASFWMFQREIDSRKIKLIVRQLKGGKKHFYSIFSNKKKPLSD